MTKLQYLKLYDTSTKADTYMNRIQSLKISPFLHGQLIYDKGVKNTKTRQSLQKTVLENWKFTAFPFFFYLISVFSLSVVRSILHPSKHYLFTQLTFTEFLLQSMFHATCHAFSY